MTPLNNSWHLKQLVNLLTGNTYLC